MRGAISTELTQFYLAPNLLRRGPAGWPGRRSRLDDSRLGGLCRGEAQFRICDLLSGECL